MEKICIRIKKKSNNKYEVQIARTKENNGETYILYHDEFDEIILDGKPKYVTDKL